MSIHPATNGRGVFLGPRSGDCGTFEDDSFHVHGLVEAGDRRGRTIGFPTANVRLAAAHARIEDGVYAAVVRLEDGRSQPAAVSIGRRPTFYRQGERLLEAHLLDFDGDLYGSHVEVTLVEFIRAQTRFESLDDLVDQLRADVRECHQILLELR